MHIFSPKKEAVVIVLTMLLSAGVFAITGYASAQHADQPDGNQLLAQDPGPGPVFACNDGEDNDDDGDTDAADSNCCDGSFDSESSGNCSNDGGDDGNGDPVCGSVSLSGNTATSSSADCNSTNCSNISDSDSFTAEKSFDNPLPASSSIDVQIDLLKADVSGVDSAAIGSATTSLVDNAGNVITVKGSGVSYFHDGSDDGESNTVTSSPTQNFDNAGDTKKIIVEGYTYAFAGPDGQNTKNGPTSADGKADLGDVSASHPSCGGNNPPTADDDGTVDAGICADSDGLIIDVLDNDDDPDNDPLSIDSVGIPSNGTTVIIDDNGTDKILYTPSSAPDTVTFDYTVSDGNGGTDTATVTVAVNGTTGSCEGSITVEVEDKDGNPVGADSIQVEYDGDVKDLGSGSSASTTVGLKDSGADAVIKQEYIDIPEGYEFIDGDNWVIKDEAVETYQEDWKSELGF